MIFRNHSLSFLFSLPNPYADLYYDDVCVYDEFFSLDLPVFIFVELKTVPLSDSSKKILS